MAVDEGTGIGLTLSALHAANLARQAEWCPDQVPDLSFRGNELGGECGEAQNVIKKLERERHGWRGSRATLAQLAEELADVIICADLCAITAGIDLDAAVRAKFNATSEANGLSTRIPAAMAPAAIAGERETERDRAQIADALRATYRAGVEWARRNPDATAYDNYPETLASIALWAHDTFGPIASERIVSRAAEEMEELRISPTNVEEAADVVICLARFPGLTDAITRKMEVNRARRWRLMGDGTGYHIKDAAP